MISTDSAIHRLNRDAFFQLMPDNSVAVLFAKRPMIRSADTEYPYCQDKNFYYLTGYNYKGAVLALVKKDGMPEYAKKVYQELKSKFKVFYDESGAVGRRYARMDEAGCPFCVTVDGQTLEDDTMTLRDRDSMEQTRMKTAEVIDFITEKVKG